MSETCRRNHPGEPSEFVIYRTGQRCRACIRFNTATYRAKNKLSKAADEEFEPWVGKTLGYILRAPSGESFRFSKVTELTDHLMKDDDELAVPDGWTIERLVAA